MHSIIPLTDRNMHRNEVGVLCMCTLRVREANASSRYKKKKFIVFKNRPVAIFYGHNLDGTRKLELRLAKECSIQLCMALLPCRRGYRQRHCKEQSSKFRQSLLHFICLQMESVVFISSVLHSARSKVSSKKR